MKGIRILPFDQYVIDSVRRKRLEKGVSQRELSSAIGAAKSFVGNVESPNSPHKYQIHHLKLLAPKLECGIHDLLPKEPLESDSYQLKTVALIDKAMGPAAMLNALLEDGFFEEPKTIAEITSKCNSASDIKRKMTDFSSALDRMVENKKIQKVPIDKNHVKYKAGK